MKLHPVTLHSSEAKAILAGKQTQIRVAAWMLDDRERKPTRYQKLNVGDLLWVQEAFVEFVGWRKGAGLYGIGFGAVGTGARCPEHMRGREYKVHQRQPKHMDRKQSRLALEVERAGVVRLGDISNDDLVASGIVESWRDGLCGYAPFADPLHSCHAQTPRAAFEKFWNHCHGRDFYRPDSEVVAIAFRAYAECVNDVVARLNGESGELIVAAEALR
jgi:hypothetical protein